MCRYNTDINITIWDTAQYFHSKQLLKKSFEKICPLIFVQVGCKSQKSYFQITWSFMPAGISYNVIVLVIVLVSQFPEVANEKRSICHTEDNLLQFLQSLC